MDSLYKECFNVFEHVKKSKGKVYIRVCYFPIYQRFIIKGRSSGGFRIYEQVCIPPLWITLGLNKGRPMCIGTCNTSGEVIYFLQRRLKELKLL